MTMTRRSFTIGAGALMAAFAAAECPASDSGERITVRPEATRDALVNPGMGWVFYYYDNSNWNYGADTKPGDTLDWFPGCSTIYFRLPWRDLEPVEGEVRWDVIDSIAQTWIAAGKQISFRFTCSESGYEYAVPEWLPAAGAKGGFFQMKRRGKDDPGRKVYEPDFLDPVFLAKFENFLAAAGRRWNGNPAVAFIDVGSFGMWGEGHTGFTSKIPAEKTRRIALVHARLHKKHFPDTPVLISDDVAGGSNKDPDDPTMAALREMGVGFRDDSIMVQKRPRQWYHGEWARQFARAGLPVMVESRHFFPAGVPECWYEGGLYESTIAYQASFQAIHWWPDELLERNRPEIERINLRMGYRFTLKEADWPRSVRVGERCEIKAVWANAGVARPGEELFAAWTLLDGKGTVIWTSVDETFDFRSLPPTLEEGETAVGRTSLVRFGWDWPYNGNYYGTPPVHVGHDGKARRQYGPKVPTIPPGEYGLCVSVGKRDGTPRIALPLRDGAGRTRRYRLGHIRVTAAPGL